MKTIYLHVGNFKTGTSAIQKFCSDNRSSLLESGYDYIRSARPRTTPTNHGKLPLSLASEYDIYVPAWYREKDDFKSVSKAVIEEIEGSSCNNIIISSEEFYRFAGNRDATVGLLSEELRKLFSRYNVKVIIYVREPLGMAKSWYNQANKGRAPTRRFMDFFYYMNTSLLLPQKNAALWRDCFGTDCLVLEPYRLSRTDHIHRFLALMGAQLPLSVPLSERLVNKKRKDETIELDRIARVMRIESDDERAMYLESFVLKNKKNTELLLEKINLINIEFLNFCQREGLDYCENAEFTLNDLAEYEEKINNVKPMAFSLLRRKLGEVRYSRLARFIKRAI